MQSTALALMSCENANAAQKGRAHPYPLVPVYDLVVFCDLGFEPPWVMRQAEFVHQACQDAHIRYDMLHTPLWRTKNSARESPLRLNQCASATTAIVPPHLRDRLRWR